MVHIIWTILFLFPLLQNASVTEPVYHSPDMLMLNRSETTLFICENTSHTIAVMEIQTGRITRRYPVSGPPGGLVLTPDQQHLIVATSSPQGIIHSIDLKTHKVTELAKAGHTPTAVLIQAGSERLFICNRFNNDVSVIDLKSGAHIKRIPVKREPVAAVMSKTQDQLLVVNQLPAGSSTADRVYAEISVINTEKLTVEKSIALPDGSTGLQGICLSPDGRLACVTHILAQYKLPTTQLNRGWMINNALSIIDLEKLELLHTVLLDDVDQGAANPWQAVYSADGRYVCVSHAGSDELSVIDQHALNEILGSAGTDKVIYDLSTLVGIRQRIHLPGNGARGVVMKGHTAWVAQFFSDNICKVKIDPAGIPEITSFPLGPDQELTEQRRGNLVFNSAQYCFQQWQSCASCHPGDARVDGLNWDLLNDGAGNAKNTRSLLYAHRTPPVMSLGVRATAEMAVRAGMHHIQFVELPEEEAMAIDVYLKSLKPVPSPFLADGKRNRSARKGEKVFQKANCATCHSGSMYTDQKSYDVNTGTGKDSGKAFDTPALNELWRTGPYLHDGRAVTLYEVLGKYNRNDRHGKTTNLTSQEMDDLVAYLLTL